MAKEDIFSKINIIGNYNNELEAILEKKGFSEDVKNLLLNMLYKIENAYSDYETVKRDVETKKDYVKNIIQTIQEQCNQIEFVKPYTKESEILEGKNFKVDKEKGKIISYQNEKVILEALVSMAQKENVYLEGEEIIEPSIAEFLKQGSIMNEVEVIRDFNGWSWDVLTKEMGNLYVHILYQDLLLLLGESFMRAWVNKEETFLKEEDFIEEKPINNILSNKNFDNIYKEEQQPINYLQEMKERLREKCGEELASSMLKVLYQIWIAIYTKENEEERDRLKKKYDEVENLLDAMKNRESYIENKTKEKKEIVKKIKQIDTIINDDALLKEEYSNRNRNLPNKEKIFSISHLVDRLEEERNQYMLEIKEINQSIEPKQFVQNQKNLEQEKEFWEEIGIEQEDTYTDILLEKWQKLFLQALDKKLDKAESKKQITDFIYLLRYVYYIPIPQNYVGKSELAKTERIALQKKCIQKACEKKVLERMSEEEETNYLILQYLFASKIIRMENIYLKIRYKDGILWIEAYDENILERKIEKKLKQNTELSVKLNKKIKLFT